MSFGLGKFSNVTGVFPNRTLPRPTWREWEQCFAGRPVAAVCRLRLKSDALAGANASTVLPALTARSAPFTGLPELPDGGRRHVYGRLRSCAMSADPADYNATSGAPLRVECAYHGEPAFTARGGNATSVVASLQYDGDTAYPGVRAALPSPLAGGATVKVGGALLAQPALQFPKFT